jgi:hypothetical protein
MLARARQNARLQALMQGRMVPGAWHQCHRELTHPGHVHVDPRRKGKAAARIYAAKAYQRSFMHD